MLKETKLDGENIMDWPLKNLLTGTGIWEKGREQLSSSMAFHLFNHRIWSEHHSGHPKDCERIYFILEID